MKKILKSIAFLTAFFLISCGEEQAQEQHHASTKHATEHTVQEQSQSIAKNVDVSEFKKLIQSGKGVIVDVRTPGEFNRGHIEGAKNINIANNFSNEIQKLDKSQPVYVYCAVGGRSARAMQMMKQMGFKEVYNLMGGYNAWARQ